MKQSRWKSPVVWIEFIAIVSGAIVAMWPGIEAPVKFGTAIIVAAISLFAAVNDPIHKDGL